MEFDYGNKQEFLTELGKFLKEQVPDYDYVDHLTYVIVDGDEYVYLVSTDGGQRRVLITGDSQSGIMLDLLNHAPYAAWLTPDDYRRLKED